jgi:uncharacterized LabA/DUF88 family protein
MNAGIKEKMKNQENNHAYIDGANLHKGVVSARWDMDYKKFRIWPSEKYGVSRVYLFMGLIPKYNELYVHLQEAGFTLFFKEVVCDGDGKPKGNCDADMVLHAVCDAYEKKFDRAVLVTSDGDYACFVKFLLRQNKFLTILSPHPSKRCSVLLKRTNARISYIDDQRANLSRVQKEKAPDGDFHHKGLLRKYMSNVPNTHKKSRRLKSGFSTVQGAGSAHRLFLGSKIV